MSVLESVIYTSARKSCLTLLQKRDYAKDELRKKIEGYGFSKSTALKVTNELERLGFLNDVRFADVFVRSKINAGWGLSRIERELCRRGVDTSCIEGWPYAYIDPDDEFERAKEIASRKTVRPPNEFGKMVRFLMGRGFAQGVSIDAARFALGTK